MTGKEERPYFKSSISQLERLFEQLKTNADSLKFLDYELSFRTTNRAAKLRSRVAETLGRRTTLTREQSEVLTGTPVPPPMDLGELPSIPIPLRMQTSQQPFSRHGPRWKRCLRKPTVGLKIWRWRPKLCCQSIDRWRPLEDQRTLTTETTALLSDNTRRDPNGPSDRGIGEGFR